MPGYIVFQMQKEQGVISSPCPNLFLCVNKLFIYNLCYLSANAIHTFYSYLCILFLFLPLWEHDTHNTHSKRGYSLG